MAHQVQSELFRLDEIHDRHVKKILLLHCNDVAFSRTNPLDWIVDIREHDMPHHVRTSIDKELFVGSW